MWLENAYPDPIYVYLSSVNKCDQGVENVGLAFVKEANERNEFFEKINKQFLMYGEQVRSNKVKD